MRALAWRTAVSVCLMLASGAALATIPSSERAVLVTLYDTTAGASWGRNGGWKDAPGTECGWYGVTCDSGQTTVTRLELGYNNVAGPIPTSITGLPNLEVLDLTANPLTGSFPIQLTQLSKLRELRLGEFYGNPLGGTIPPAIANLANLEVLDLFGNNFTGTLPAAIATMPKLRRFQVWVNQLTGEIPPAFFTNPRLEYLDLSYNSFSGGLPSTISAPALLELYLQRCGLSGPIPSSLGSLPKLTRLALNENAFSGPIPTSLGQLATLEYLTLYGNQLTGGMPSELGNLTNLTYLDVGNNPITGPIPSSIGNLKKLKFFSTFVSTLSGPIPDSLFTLPVLETLYLSGNSYDGQSSTELTGRLIDFTRLTRLKDVDVNGQAITGPIPPQIAALTQLEAFKAAYNPIGGSIPPELGQLSKLGHLDLRSAELSGPIPESFGLLTNLHGLDLRDNRITALPASFSSLQALKSFSLQGNGMTGLIPLTIAQLPELNYLSLRENGFSGSIPPELFRLGKLVGLDLADNQLTGTIPPLSGLASIEELNLDQNQLSGPIPSDVTSRTKLTRLDMSDNKLTDPIPEMPLLASLRELDLSNNELSGSIPALTGLSSLRRLYLGYNRLTGAIPASIGLLTQLERAEMPYNALVGQIPKEVANCSNMQDGGFFIHHNGLYNNDASIRDYLTRTTAGFETRQTVAPENVTVSATREKSLVLSWTPIANSADAGGYIISVATSASGPFAAAVTTPDKFSSTFTLDGLTPSTDYFVRVSTATYSTPDNKNTVVSDPSPVVAARTTTGAPAPASVVVLSLPGGIYQDANVAGGSDGYTLANVGDLPTTITMSQEGDFFTQAPASFTLGPGAVQIVALNGLARPAGVYNGASIPSGAGVPAGLRAPVRLLSTTPVVGTVNAVASANRVDVAAAAEQTSLPASVSFTNTGTATLTGILVTEASWVTPPQGVVTIAPGQTTRIDFMVDRTKRADATQLAGTAISSLSLVYPTGTAQGARSTHEGAATGVSLVTVVDTVKPPKSDVPFPPLLPGEVPLFLAGVGHIVGGLGLFVSDLSVINAFGTNALGDVRIYYTPAVGFPLSNSVTSANAISPGQSFALADVVKSVFDAEQVGTIQVRSVGWSSLVLNSNIFNITNPRGTFGSSIPSFRGDRAIGAGSSLLISGVRKDALTRTNVFIQETGGLPANVDLDFYDAAGAIVPSPAASAAAIPPFQLVRLLDSVPPGAVSVRIANRGDSQGQIVAYATPVDQTSGDFWSLADWSRVYASSQSEVQVIPVAGRVRGANNNYFRSDVSITAAGGSPAAASMKFFYDGGRASADASISLAAGETRVIEDIVGTLFPALPETVVGYAILTPSTGALAVTSRTYATQDGVPGTFGTAVPTLPLSRTIRLGQTKIIAGLDVAAAKTTGAKTPATFRTNLFLVEASGAPAKVRVTVVYADRSQAAFGSRLVTKTIDLAANQIFQTNVSQLIAETNPTVDDLRNVQLEFRVIEGSGAVFAFTSSIDNGTADQILRVE